MTYPSLNHPQHLYFVTATICGWKRLFNDPAYAQIVLNSLQWMRQDKRIFLFVFVLMPSHLHAILKPRALAVGDVLQQFGSYTAHVILKRLRQDNRQALIEFFHEQRRKQGDQHSIWQDIQAQNIFTIEFLEQKMEYIHSNPVRKEWKLLEDRADYLYSSACDYDRGGKPVIEVDDVSEWLAADSPLQLE
jgi:REP element-mobilizing transposase RayT